MNSDPFNTLQCFAYCSDGTICRKPAFFFDEKRGFFVCHEHKPRPTAEEHDAFPRGRYTVVPTEVQERRAA